MRNCCSRDLLDPGSHVRDFAPIWGATPTAPFLPHHSHRHSGSHIRTPAFVRQVRDFDPIWLDDFLDYLIVPFSSQAPARPPRPPARAASASDDAATAAAASHAVASRRPLPGSLLRPSPTRPPPRRRRRSRARSPSRTRSSR